MSVEERKREEGIRKQTGDTMKLTFETLHAETLHLRLCSLYCVNSCTPARSARHGPHNPAQTCCYQQSPT